MLLRGIAERVVEAREQGGVGPGDSDLLAFMLRQREAGSTILTRKQIIDDVGPPAPLCPTTRM